MSLDGNLLMWSARHKENRDIIAKETLEYLEGGSPIFDYP